MEIRRSVMARPNLSCKNKLLAPSAKKLVLERKQTGGTVPAAVSFPIRPLRSAGGAGVSTSTLGKIFFANSAAVLRDLRGQKLGTAEHARARKAAGEKSPLAAEA
jgi:hypothetical protein